VETPSHCDIRLMNEDLTQSVRAMLLPGFGVLRISGQDAVSFLQGQFTNDVKLLADGRTQVAACCSNQGRVIAIVRFRQTDEAIYALLPADPGPGRLLPTDPESDGLAEAVAADAPASALR